MRKIIILDEKETNYEVTSDGKIYNKKTGRELKGSFKSQEYQTVQLFIDKKPKTCLVHRLVAEAFCEKPEGSEVVDHINRIKTDNRAENLRWVTQKENCKNTKKREVSPIKKFEGELDENWVQIKICPSIYINKNGEIINIATKRYLLGSLRNGYKRVNIQNKAYLVHLLVWTTFKGDIPEDYVIDHIDGNKENNKLENLRLVTQSENIKNAYKNGAGKQIKVKQIDNEGNIIAKFDSIQKAADAMGVTHAAIRSAINRKGKCKTYYWEKEE